MTFSVFQNRLPRAFALTTLFPAFLVFQIGTGLALWLPFYRQAFSGAPLSLVWLHVINGSVIAAMIAYRLYKRGGKLSIFPAAVEVFFQPLLNKTGGQWRSPVLASLLLLLALSGLVLIPGQWAPPPVLSTALYFHGAGFMLLVPLLFGSLVYEGSKVLRPVMAVGDATWQSPGLAEKYSLAGEPVVSGKSIACLFLEKTAVVLKYSGIKILLEGIADTENCVVPAGVGRQVFHFTAENTAGECLAAIYRRYFTLSGWLAGWLPGAEQLTDENIHELSRLFYGYVPCPTLLEASGKSGNEALMAKLGRFILSQAGVTPFEQAQPGRIELKERTGSGMHRMISVLENRVLGVPGVKVKATLNKKNADVLFVPAVHDYSGQSDTLQGLAAVFQAQGLSWTLGRVFFDGMNYGTMHGAWYVERVQEAITSLSKSLEINCVVLGGCSGVSYRGDSENFFSANEYVHQALQQNSLAFSIGKMNREKTGFMGFCDSGCHLDDSGKSLAIAEAIVGKTGRAGSQHNRVRVTDEEILNAIAANHWNLVIAPFHNTRERVKHLVSENNLNVEVTGLYELIAATIKIG